MEEDCSSDIVYFSSERTNFYDVFVWVVFFFLYVFVSNSVCLNIVIPLSSFMLVFSLCIMFCLLCFGVSMGSLQCCHVLVWVKTNFPTSSRLFSPPAPECVSTTSGRERCFRFLLSVVVWFTGNWTGSFGFWRDIFSLGEKKTYGKRGSRMQK